MPNSSGSQRQPTTSLDGAKLLFTHVEPTRSELRLRDMASGKDTVLQAGYVRGVISPDGAKVAFSDLKSVSMMDAAGGETTKLVESPALQMFGWTPDGRSLVFWKGGPIRYFTLDPSDHESREPMRDTRFVIHSLEFAQECRWATFHAADAPPATRVRFAGSRRDRRRRKRVDSGVGYRWEQPALVVTGCEPAQLGVGSRRLPVRLGTAAGSRQQEVRRRSLSGDPHSTTLAAVSGNGVGGFGPAVSRDWHIFALPEYSGNIWLAEKISAK